MSAERLVVAGAIVRRTATGTAELLLAQRDRPADVAGLWELPGGKVEPGEGTADALRRELAEELGVEVEVGDELTGRTAVSATMTLVARHARIVGGRPEPHDHRALAWVDARRLRALADAGALVPADTVWLPELLPMLGG